jgi:hypothetical protein
LHYRTGIAQYPRFIMHTSGFLSSRIRGFGYRIFAARKQSPMIAPQNDDGDFLRSHPVEF